MNSRRDNIIVPAFCSTLRCLRSHNLANYAINRHSNKSNSKVLCNNCKSKKTKSDNKYKEVKQYIRDCNRDTRNITVNNENKDINKRSVKNIKKFQLKRDENDVGKVLKNRDNKEYQNNNDKNIEKCITKEVSENKYIGVDNSKELKKNSKQYSSKRLKHYNNIEVKKRNGKEIKTGYGKGCKKCNVNLESANVLKLKSLKLLKDSLQQALKVGLIGISTSGEISLKIPSYCLKDLRKINEIDIQKKDNSQKRLEKLLNCKNTNEKIDLNKVDNSEDLKKNKSPLKIKKILKNNIGKSYIINKKELIKNTKNKQNCSSKNFQKNLENNESMSVKKEYYKLFKNNIENGKMWTRIPSDNSLDHNFSTSYRLRRNESLLSKFVPVLKNVKS